MKAILCEKYGPPSDLVYRETDDPKPGPKDVVIDVRACSVNFPDTLIIQGKYQFKPEFPFSPGSDVAGIVCEIGSEVKSYKIGDEVFGFVGYGGYAEKVKVNYKQVFPKIREMDFATAASFMLAYGTSYHALKDRAQIQPGETMVVLGAAGGVGLAAVELGKIMGVNVIAAASTDEKLELTRSYGASHTINYSKEDLKARIKELTDGKGADVIYDPVGSTYSEPALRAMNYNGRFLVIGFAAGDIPKIPLNLPLLKGCQIVGVFWGSFAERFPNQNFQNSMDLIELYKTKKIKPYIDKLYPLSDAPQALQDIMDRKVKGKFVITM